MTFALRQEDLSFLARAPIRQVHRGHVELSADHVFDSLAERPEDWPAWFSLARECHYEGPPPHHVGTSRLISVRGGVRARERLLAWDEGKRFAYRIEEINVPGIRAAMEEWTLMPMAANRTEVRWVLAVDCVKPVGLALQAAGNPIDHYFSRATRRMAVAFYRAGTR